jgi:hypothetical protein
MFDAIPTHYRGINFRSRFEADTAFWLDGLKLLWEYEPTSYLLDSGIHYRPDFWIEKLGLFVESRGYVNQEGMQQLIQFSQWIWDGKLDRMKWRTVVPATVESYPDYLVIGPDAVRFVEAKARAGTGLLRDVSMIRCGECGTYFFVGHGGAQTCRACGASRGQHERFWPLTFKSGALSIAGQPIRDWVQDQKAPEPSTAP